MSTPLLNVTSISSDLFDQDRLALEHATSYASMLQEPSISLDSVQTIKEKYANLSRDELVEILANTELRCSHLESENFAFTSQVSASSSDLINLQSEITKLKLSQTDKIGDLTRSRDKWRSLSETRESEIIFLEDHARFSAEQTRLSISHWDLLLRNRDENIELLSARVSQLTADSRSANEGISADKHKCLLERYQRLLELCDGNVVADMSVDFPPVVGGKIECPWRHQADVRVAQLERVTSQLNSTYEQLHTKSDEMLLQNRTVGTLRRRILELEAKNKKYRSRMKSPIESSPTTSVAGTD